MEALADTADPDLAVTALARVVGAQPADGPVAGLVAALRERAGLRRRLLRVLGVSTALGDHLAAHPGDWRELDDDDAACARPSLLGLQARLLRAVGADPADPPPWGSGGARAAGTGPEVVAALRRAYRGCLLSLAARDLSGDVAVEDVAGELADLAAATLAAGLAVAQAGLADGAAPCRLAVVGMGKCGGRELNYVSDVDVVFVAEPVPRDPAGEPVDETAALRTATQLATAMVRVCGEAAWPVDAALRPEGAAGPLVRTLASHAAYYRRWASTWEFQALLKARPVAGDVELGARYTAELAPLVWAASARPGFVEDVQAMRRRVESTLGSDRADREVKLGRGGLRDVEFAVQLLQLVHGRDDDAVRSGTTLTALDQLAEGGYVGREDARHLAEAYRWLRTVEHRLQLHRLRRTHLLPAPDDAEGLRRVARAAGYRADAEALFSRERAGYRREVRRLHEKLFYRPLLGAVARLPAGSARLSPQAAGARLAALGFADPAAALRHLQALTSGVSRRAAIQQTLLPVMLDWFAGAADPDAGLLGYRQVSDALGTTPWYLRLLRDEGAAARAARRAARHLALRRRPARPRPRGGAAARRRRRAAPARPGRARRRVRADRAPARRLGGRRRGGPRAAPARAAAGRLRRPARADRPGRGRPGAVRRRRGDRRGGAGHGVAQGGGRAARRPAGAGRGARDGPPRRRSSRAGAATPTCCSCTTRCPAPATPRPPRSRTTSPTRPGGCWPCRRPTRRCSSTPTCGRRAGRARSAAASPPTPPTTPAGRPSGRRRRCCARRRSPATRTWPRRFLALVAPVRWPAGGLIAGAGRRGPPDQGAGRDRAAAARRRPPARPQARPGRPGRRRVDRAAAAAAARARRPGAAHHLHARRPARRRRGRPARRRGRGCAGALVGPRRRGCATRWCSSGASPRRRCRPAAASSTPSPAQLGWPPGSGGAFVDDYRRTARHARAAVDDAFYGPDRGAPRRLTPLPFRAWTTCATRCGPWSRPTRCSCCASRGRATAPRCCCCTACPRPRPAGATSPPRSRRAGGCSHPTCPASAGPPTPGRTTSPRSSRSSRCCSRARSVARSTSSGTTGAGCSRSAWPGCARTWCAGWSSSTRPTGRRRRCGGPCTCRSSRCRPFPSWPSPWAAAGSSMPCSPPAGRRPPRSTTSAGRSTARRTARASGCGPAWATTGAVARPRAGALVPGRGLARQLPQVHVDRALVLWGALDPALPISTGEAAVRDLGPGTTMTTVPGAGHFVVEEAPDAVAEVLRDFLA